MSGLPYIETSAPAPIRVPRVELVFGTGGDSGGFGGLADAAGGNEAPAWADYLVSLTLCQGLAPRVDLAELLIAQTGRAPTAELGEPAQIRMGEADALEDLFAGTVIGIEQRGDGMRRYRLGNASHTLAQGRLDLSLTETTVQDAIAFAADAMGIAVQARIDGEDGTLHQYVFDSGRSVWDHLAQLGALRGFDLWVDAAGDLQVADRLEQGDPVQTFAYGQDLIAAGLWQRSPHSGQVTVLGGARTDDGFTLRKDPGPNRAQGGEGAPQRLYRHGALQSPADLSGRVAAATRLGDRRTSAGELLVPGSAALAPARTIAVRDLPAGDRTFLILALEHRFDWPGGWRTRLTLCDAANAPGAI